MRKSLLAFGLVFGLSLAAAPPASANANFLGTRGLLVAPTADTVGAREFGAHLHVHDDFQSYGLLAGVSDRLELGLTFLNLDNAAGDDSEFLVNAKFALLRENIAVPGVAVGVIDAFDELDADTSWYLVASKGFPNVLPIVGGLRLHAGYGGGIFADELFFGLELQVGTPLDVLPVTHPTFYFLAEYVNDDVNLGLRGRWSGFSAEVGLFDFEDFGFGASYITTFR